MKIIRTILFGAGTVNIGLLKILSEKQQSIERNYGLKFVMVAVADSSGIAVCAEGFEYGELITLKANKQKVRALKNFLTGASIHEITSHVPNADLLIDGSPGNLLTGEPALSVSKLALKKGWSVVFANKAPLVIAYDELWALAKENKCRIACSATVCGGLPVINVLTRDLKETTLIRLRGIFNATTNYILQELERGGTIDEAIKEAQRLGAAEADPSYDTKGFDTANKLFLIMKVFTGYTGSIKNISIRGIETITPLQIAEANKRGNKIKLLALAEYHADEWKLSVEPAEIAAQSFLGSCQGWEMGIELETDLYESISMKNYEADPVGTSAAVLRDAIDLALANR